MVQTSKDGNTKSVAPNICTTAVMPEVVKKYFELYPAS